MPRFDLRVEFPNALGERTQFHAVGQAADLEQLPNAVAASLGARITELCGVVSDGAGSADDEKKYADAVQAFERSHGPMDHATKNGLRKALKLNPLRRGQEVDKQPTASESAQQSKQGR